MCLLYIGKRITLKKNSDKLLVGALNLKKFPKIRHQSLSLDFRNKNKKTNIVTLYSLIYNNSWKTMLDIPE